MHIQKVGYSLAMIDIALCFSDPDGLYYRKATTTMLSVFEHTSSAICVHIVHDKTLDIDKQNEMRMVAEQYKQSICFYLAPSLDEFSQKAGAWGKGVFYRLLLYKILELDNVIYLDCDIICELDIKELYEHSLDDLPLGAVVEVGMAEEVSKSTGLTIKEYFNSGVLLLNLKWFREQHNDIFAIMMQELNKRILRYPDQDILNIFFSQHQYNVMHLDEKFNYILHINQRHIKPLQIYKGKILHMTKGKPWTTFSHPSIFYWKYYSKTPWGKDTFEEILKTKREESLELTHFILKHAKGSLSWLRRYRDFKQLGFSGYLKQRIFGKKCKKSTQTI